MFVQNAVWNFQILKEQYAILKKLISLKKSLNAIRAGKELNSKDILNRTSGVIAAGTFAIILLGIIAENDSLLGFPNAMMLYGLMPSALIWFGTRKNGCGSCNQTCDVSEQDQDMKK